MREINHLSLHQWLRSAISDSQQPTSPIGFLFLKLPPPPCAVLLVPTALQQNTRNIIKQTATDPYPTATEASHLAEAVHGVVVRVTGRLSVDVGQAW